MSQMGLVFLILGITTVCFLVPKFRSDIVALISLLALYLFEIITVQEAFSGFANSVVIMIAALFVVGEGVFQTGLANAMGNSIIKMTGTSEFRMYLVVLTAVAVLSSFMSNTGTVAILLPVIFSLSRKINTNPSSILMPLAFASSIGGTFTLIGTAPNLIANQSLVSAGLEPLSFFAFTPLGVIIFVVAFVYMWFISRKILNKNQAETETGNEIEDVKKLTALYHIEEHIKYIEIPKRHSSIGKSIQETEWDVKYHINFLEALKQDTKKKFLFKQNPNTNWVTVTDTYVIDEGDKLIVSCDTEEYEAFLAENQLTDITKESENIHSLDKIQLAEVILTPNSSLINKSLAENHFRHKYGLTVIALKHQYHEARIATKNDTLSYGDTLLVHGSHKDIQVLAEEKDDTVVLTFTGIQNFTADDKVHITIAGAILLVMVAFLIQPWYSISATMVIVIAALAMVLSGCIKQPDHAYRSINWSTVVLIAAMLPMATALQKTNGIDYISNALIGSLGAFGPLAILAGLFALASVFSQFISNTATAVLLYPVAILTAQQLGVNAQPMVMSVAFSASMAFATPVATPPNAMVMAAGKYTFFDFIKIGLPMQIFIAVIIVLLIPVFYPL